MEIKVLMFLNFFDVISMYFRCFISMFNLSTFCLFDVFAFQCFVILCFFHRSDLILRDRSDDSKSLQLSLEDTVMVSCSFLTALMTSLAGPLRKVAYSAAFFS